MSRLSLLSARRRAWLCLSAALVSAPLLTACEPVQKWFGQAGGAHFNGVDITGANYAQDFKMKDYDGQVRELAEFRGKLVFVFFGFTQCPDVCPTTMAEVAELRRRLGPDGDKLQAVFVSVDPERDTPAVLKAYLQGMDPSFIGLTGSDDEIKALARHFKVFYQRVDGANGQYTFDHTAGAYLFDPQGKVRLFVRYGMPFDQLESDVRQLLGLSATSDNSTKL